MAARTSIRSVFALRIVVTLRFIIFERLLKSRRASGSISCQDPRLEWMIRYRTDGIWRRNDEIKSITLRTDWRKSQLLTRVQTVFQYRLLVDWRINIINPNHPILPHPSAPRITFPTQNARHSPSRPSSNTSPPNQHRIPTSAASFPNDKAADKDRTLGS